MTFATSGPRWRRFWRGSGGDGRPIATADAERDRRALRRHLRDLDDMRRPGRPVARHSPRCRHHGRRSGVRPLQRLGHSVRLAGANASRPPPHQGRLNVCQYRPLRIARRFHRRQTATCVAGRRQGRRDEIEGREIDDRWQHSASALRVVAAFGDEHDPAVADTRRPPAASRVSRAESVRRHPHAGQRIALVRVEARRDEHQLRA